jgi:hypothetical protein
VQMNRDTVIKVGVFSGLVALCAAARLLPHPPNFTPIAATALFAGFFFPRRPVALMLPLFAVLVSDSLLGTYSWPVMFTVFACHLLPVLLGTKFKKRLSVLRVGGCAALSSLIFFLGTNFSVWYFGPLYEKTASGLLACYTAALPFFRNSLAGNMVWTAVLFGIYVAATQWASQIHERRMVPERVKNR